MTKMRKALVTLTVISAVLLSFLAWKMYCWIWLKPRRMEKYLREKGVAGPELIREIFLNKSECFAKTWSDALTKLLICGVVTYERRKWAKYRRIMNATFHPEKLKMMSPAFYTSCSNLIRKWQGLAAEGSCELGVWPDLQSLTRDVISRAAFGSSYEEERRIFQLTYELAEHVFYFSVSVNIPGFRFLPTNRSNRMKKIAVDIQELLMGIINKRLEAMKTGVVSDDLLGLLIESNSEKILEC